ncbi:MAG TPA: HAD family phosphatase [Kiritimatiellia bacterium]|nr:HAD family phosphatase [Kiritimatiellia bacterium]
MQLQAVIFDFDGIVVDSEPLHHAAFVRILEPLNLDLSWDRYCGHYLGFDDRDVIRERFREAERPLDDSTMRQLMEQKARVFVEIVEKQGITPYPGVVTLIRYLYSRVPLAICSGALKSDIDPILRILDVEDCFPIKVTADQVHVSKPDPESYFAVFNRLQEMHPSRVLSPSACFAIEDTPAGIAAARGAGLNVLAVSNTYQPDLLAGANHIVDSLEHVDMAMLENLLPG